MKNNKILALLLLFMVSEFSFAADLPHTLKDSATSLGEHASCEAFRLFSAAEREEFETGMGIIQDRILQKTELLGMLRDPSRSLAERLAICDQDFNAQPKKLITIGTSYSDYLDLILSVYTKTYELAQCIQLASNDSEKNTCQNNLYYYLSYKIIYFQHFIATLPHKVPETLN